MYAYNDFDRAFVKSRVAEFRDQVARRLDGSLSEDEFRPLRLMNGLYLLLHAYMLRIAVPYGTLNSAQMNKLAHVADRWDKGYVHFSTRQNVQFHWPRLTDVPDILEALSDVDMHAIQTSGSCVRAVTADHLAGAVPDEVEDPRPTAELIRQWFTDHPEFSYLPRKFKFAVTGCDADRAATSVHDIGLKVVKNENGAPGYCVSVGGGLGRTPMIGRMIRDFLPREDLLPYIEAVLQVYNQNGRRDNKYKARIKITLHEMGLEELKSRVEERFLTQRTRFKGADQAEFARIASHFTPPALEHLSTRDFEQACATNPVLRSFVDTNTQAHRDPDHAIVTVSLKKPGTTPGDASTAQMRALAKIAERWSHDELRVSHEQNIILPHVAKAHLPAVFAALQEADLASANVGLISDLISCPGMDYCDLATARSIPVAKAIATHFADLRQEHDIGPIKLKISGCINACGHHHVGHIGILGLEKGGVESYQITLGGDATEKTALGERAGPGFSAEEILPAIQTVIGSYLALRNSVDEAFIDTYRRLGMAPFRAALYPQKEQTRAA